MLSLDCVRCLGSLVRAAPWRAALIVDGVIKNANTRFLDFFGLEESAALGKRPAALMPGLPLAGLFSRAGKSLSSVQVEGEATIQGQPRALRVHLTPISPHSAVLLTVADLTAQREAQAGMAYQMAGGAEDFWVFDEDHNLVFTNAMHLTDVPIPESRDVLSLFTPESRARAEANFSWARAHPGQLVRDSFKVRSGRRIITIEVDGSFRFDSEYGGHFFCILRNSSLEGVSVLNRLQQAYGVTSDAALAQKLRASPARISQTRSGQMPPARDWPTRAYEDTGFSMDWIWTGMGEMRKVK